jgi:serine/threonine protein kinase
MSAASIVGILVGTVAVALVAVAFVFWRRKRQERYSQTSKGDSLRFESSSGRNFAGNGGFKTIQSGRSQQQQLALDMGNGTFNSLNSQASQPDDGPWADPALVAARIPMEMIDKQEMISRGGFGLVFSGTYNGETVAIKTLLPENRKNMKEIEAFFAEIQLMAELEHPRIVRFIGAAWNSLSDVVCVSEFMVGGDLRMLLMNFEGDTGDASQRRPHGFDFEKVQIALHIAHGLTYLHSLAPTVLHRDLKSRNVLLSSTMEAKLTDFGVSRHRSDGLMTCNVGTSLWMAPEVMMGGQYDEKADVFSFGVLLSELDAHVTPYANVVNPSNGRRLVETAILQMVAGGTLQVEFSPECSAEMRALGRACTSLDPRNRPSASDALYKLQLALKAVQEVEVSL